MNSSADSNIVLEIALDIFTNANKPWMNNTENNTDPLAFLLQIFRRVKSEVIRKKVIKHSVKFINLQKDGMPYCEFLLACIKEDPQVISSFLIQKIDRADWDVLAVWSLLTTGGPRKPAVEKVS